MKFKLKSNLEPDTTDKDELLTLYKEIHSYCTKLPEKFRLLEIYFLRKILVCYNKDNKIDEELFIKYLKDPLLRENEPFT